MKHWLYLFITLFVFGACIPQLAEAKKEAKPPKLEVLPGSGRKDPKPKTSAKGSKTLNSALEAIYDEDDSAKGIALLDKLLAGKTTPYEKSKALQVKSSALYNEDKMPEALAAIEGAIAADGLPNLEHLEAMLMRAQLLNIAERFEESTKAFDEYFKDQPQIKGDHYAVQAQNYYELEQWDKTAALIDKALSTGDKPQTAWYQLKVNSLYQAERFDDSIAYLKELLAKNPSDKNFNNLLVSAYLSAEKLDLARDQLLSMKAANLFDSELLWTQLYQVHSHLEQPLEAAKVIEEGIAAGGIKPTCERYVDLGENYYLASDSIDDSKAAEVKAAAERTLGAFTKAAALCSDGTPEMWQCQLLLDVDRAKEAISSCEKSISKGNVKNIGNVHYLHAIALAEVGRIKDAQAALKIALTFPESKRNAETMLKNLR
jgi:tetratricopeptide (TPR) repeat protein